MLGIRPGRNGCMIQEIKQHRGKAASVEEENALHSSGALTWVGLQCRVDS